MFVHSLSSFFKKFLCFCEVLLKRRSHLVRAGRGLEAATDSVKTSDSLIDLHALKQAGNALSVTRTAADDLYLCDSVVIKLDFKLTSADSLGRVDYFFHNFKNARR